MSVAESLRDVPNPSPKGPHGYEVEVVPIPGRCRLPRRLLHRAGRRHPRHDFRPAKACEWCRGHRRVFCSVVIGEGLPLGETGSVKGVQLSSRRRRGGKCWPARVVPATANRSEGTLAHDPLFRTQTATGGQSRSTSAPNRGPRRYRNRHEPPKSSHRQRWRGEGDVCRCDATAGRSRSEDRSMIAPRVSSEPRGRTTPNRRRCAY